jgi:hypothetical protein
MLHELEAAIRGQFDAERVADGGPGIEPATFELTIERPFAADAAGGEVPSSR